MKLRYLVFALTLLGITAALQLRATAATTITFWDIIDPKGTGPREAALSRNLARFEETNPTIKVKLEVTPATLMNKQLIEGAMAHRGPDVARVYGLFIEQHVAAETLEPLDNYARDFDKNDWLLPWDTYMSGGHKYALPYEHRVLVLMYRPNALKQRGLTPPKTMEELVITAGKIGPEGPMGFAMGLGTGELGNWLGEWLCGAVWSAGGEVFNPNGKAVFNSPAGVKAFQVFPDLIYKYKGSSKATLGWGYNEPHQALMTGTALMLAIPTHRFREIRKGAPDVTMVPFPGFGTNPSVGATFGWTFVMPKYAANKAAAWKFLEFMMSPEAQVNIAKGGEIPGRKSTFNDPWFKTAEAADLNWGRDYIVKNGRTMRFPEKWLDLQLLLVEAVQKMIIQNVSVKDALDEAANKYNKLIGLQ